MIPAGRYHLLIHGLKLEGLWCWLHATTLPAGERVKLRLFDTQVPRLIIALMSQYGLPENLRGGQVLASILLHPEYGNKVRRFDAIPRDGLFEVESDVVIDRTPAFCEFEDL